MSIYSSIDAIKSILKNGAPDQPTGIMKFLRTFTPLNLFLGPSNRPLEEDEQEFLGNTVASLKLLGADYNESKREELSTIIEQIQTYKDQHPGALTPVFHYVLEDLTIVRDGQKKEHHSEESSAAHKTMETLPKQVSGIDAHYKALLKSPFLKHKLVQGKMNELGNSLGECYGFTLSMADSELSPYKNKKDKIEFNKTIYKYQKNQLDRDKDQRDIKRTRLTMKAFCPSLKEQAEELYSIASEHVGEDLSVHLQGRLGAHATYLSIQKDGKIRYADSNHGVFLFDTKDQFISAYRLMYQYHNQQRPEGAYTFYSVNKLQEDKNHELEPSNTLAGKWRSLMTGTKYHASTRSEITDPDLIIPSIIVGAGGAVAGAVIGATIGSIIPVVGTVFGGIIGGIAGALSGPAIVTQARINGHFGLLGPYHYLREQVHNLTESIKEKIGIKRECDETPDLVTPELKSSECSAAIINQGLCKKGDRNPSSPAQRTISESTLPSKESREVTPDKPLVPQLETIDHVEEEPEEEDEDEELAQQHVSNSFK